MFANAQKKNSAIFTFSFDFFEKACQQQQQPNTYFFFQKKPQKVGLRTNEKLFFSFCFLICQKKGSQETNCFVFFCWTKTLWGLEQEQESKWFEEVEILFVYFYFFAFSQLSNKKRRSAFLATSMNLPREKSFHGIFAKLLKLFFKLFSFHLR